MEIVKKPSIRFNKIIECTNCQCKLKINRDDLFLQLNPLHVLCESNSYCRYDCFTECMNCSFKMQIAVSPAIKYHLIKQLTVVDK